MARGARPRGQHYAALLEARRQARHDREDDSDDLTVPNDDGDDDDAIQIGQGDPADPDLDEEADAGVIEDTIDAIIRRSMTSMFQRVLMFNQGAAESLR